VLKIIDDGNIIRIMRGETQVCIFFFDEAEEFRRGRGGMAEEVEAEGPG